MIEDARYLCASRVSCISKVVCGWFLADVIFAY